ncbi:MAG TPA: type II toxin-antitoxin system VapC family toxin [Thermoanaerobaculia bacterium]|nr:type II toxin-antitoxin system VapC family toxin [Thermoanaerobaculia bacterium]
MIVDTSALVSMLIQEDGWENLRSAVAGVEVAGIGAPSLLEAILVVSGRAGRDRSEDVRRFVRDLGIVVISFEEEHAHVAAEAFARFGKGRHRAALNFGDCMTYAVAKIAGQPLLCTGTDFAKTDLKLA